MSNSEQEIKPRYINKEILIFAFFLCLSFLFWYLNELGKDLEASINYPVRYINPPKDRVITGHLPERIGLVLQGPGYSIFKMKFSGSRAPVVIDMSRVNSQRVVGKKNDYYIVTSDLKESFARQLRADFNISSIKPDTLFYSYDKLITKRMMIIPNVRVEVPRTHKSIVVVVPDSISVTGPKSIIDTIPGIMTRSRIFPRVSEAFKASVQLITPPYLQLSQNRVDLEITVVRKYSDKEGWATPPSDLKTTADSTK